MNRSAGYTNYAVLFSILIFFVVMSFVASAISAIFLYVVLPIALILLARFIYIQLNPNAKKAYLEKIRKIQEKEDKAKEEKVLALKNKEKALKNKEKLEKEKIIKLKDLRDSDKQESPYTYKIGKHGNESLAIRYGIANMDKSYPRQPAEYIRLQKIEKISKDLYYVILVDFGNRKAKSIIELGTEYVKTFYPLEDGWFKKHADLELTLKGNGSFTLKELAKFHVQKAVGS